MIGFTLPGSTVSWPRGYTRGIVTYDRFPNGELVLSVASKIKGQACTITGSVATDEQVLVLALLADTLRRQGAATISALIPYLAYTRQDTGRNPGLPWLSRIVRAAGISEVTTIDLHSKQAAYISEVTLRTVLPAELFVSYLQQRRLDITGATVIAPDEGAKHRAAAFAEAAGLAQPVLFHKERTPRGVKHIFPTAELTTKAIIIDDVLDSGATLVSCCRLLKKHGVKEIYVLVTHGQFTDTKWQRLWEFGVTHLVVSDSLPLPSAIRGDARVHVCSLKPLLHNILEDHIHANATT